MSDKDPHFIPEPGALAWTSDEEMEAGAARFKELWPDAWAAWLQFCESEEAK